MKATVIKLAKKFKKLIFSHTLSLSYFHFIRPENLGFIIELHSLFHIYVTVNYLWVMTEVMCSYCTMRHLLS